MTQEWISVKDQLPTERLKSVLCFNGSAPLYNQHVFQATWFSQTKRFKMECEHDFMGEITHWMPLPEPPKE